MEREKLQNTEYLENDKNFLDDIKCIFQFLQAIILWEIKKIKIADTSFKESTPTKNLQNFTKKLPFHAIQLVFWKLPYYFPIY